MAVHHPGSRAGHGIALKTIQKTVKTGGARAIFATLNVVPMIDLFIMLVIFLIQQFSAAGELMLVNPNVAMPKASSKAELERAPMVALTRGDGSTLGEMLFENKRIMSLGDVNEVKYPSWDIKPLAEVLKTSWKFQQNPRNPQKVRDSRKVIIQADRTVPFQVIKMVMATCGRNEYREPNFAIMVDGRGDEGLAGPAAAP